MRLFEISIVEGYKEAKNEFIENNDPELVDKTIQQYRDLVNRNQVQGQERNIDYWRKQGFEKFQSFVNDKSQQKSITQLKRSKNSGRSITLAENDKWLIVIPLDKDASCFHGKNTEWCTTKPFQNYFERYFYQDNVTLIYFIRKEDMEKWAIAVKYSKSASDNIDYISYYDKNDDEVSDTFFENETKLNPHKFIQMAFDAQNRKQTSDARHDWQDLYNEVSGMLSRYGIKRSEEFERKLFKLKDNDLIITYLDYISPNYETYSFPIWFQSYLVNMNGKNIRYIEEPSESIQKKAVTSTPTSIKFIDDPSDEIIKTALSKKGIAIKYIDEPSDEHKRIATSQNAKAIEFIEDPDEELQLLAVNNDGRSLQYIENPSRKVKLAAIYNYPFLYQYSSHISYDDQEDKDFMMAAVSSESMWIKDNLNLMFNADYNVDENIIREAVSNSNIHNLPGVLGVIMVFKDKLDFDPYPILKAAWNKVNKEDE